MTLGFATANISDFKAGFSYSAGNDYFVASYSSGWTITGFDVTLVMTFVASSLATNTTPWGNAAIVDPVTVGLAQVPAGDTPLAAHDSNFDSLQWLQLETIGADSVTFEVLDGSSAIGSTFVVPYRTRYRSQMRLTAATDFYVQTFQQTSTAPHFSISGTATVWNS